MASDMSARGRRASKAGDAVDDEDVVEDPRFRLMRRLVNLLLLVMIAGILAVVVAMMLKLKDFQPPVHPLKDGETIVSATASSDRVTLVLEGEDGVQRVVILDGANFQPIREILTAPTE